MAQTIERPTTLARTQSVARPSRRRPRPSLLAVLGQVGVWIWIAFAMVPFVFAIVTSLKPEGLALSIPPRWIFHPTWENYSAIVHNTTGSTEDIPSLLRHSAVVALLATLLALVVGLPAAYALAMRGFRPRKALASWILSTIMFPPTVAVIPIFILAGHLHLVDSYAVLIIPYAAFNLPMVVWILRSMIVQVPVEIEEAAMVDGCSRPGALRRVVMPLIVPGIATAAIFSIILSWNEFLFALALTRSHAKTAPVGVNEFTGLFGTQWGNLTAASMVIIAPIMVLVLLLRRRFVSGLTFGAVK